MQQLVKKSHATIIICILQMYPNFMNVSILILSHSQIILGDNPHYSNAVIRVNLIMVSRKRESYAENANIKQSTLLTPIYVAPVMSTLSEQLPFFFF